MFDIWSFVETALSGITGDILFIGANKQDLQGGVSYDFLNRGGLFTPGAIPRRHYDIIISEDIFNGSYDIKSIAEVLYSGLKPGGLWILAEPVVGFEDAYLNSFLSAVKAGHIRFHTVDEIVGVCSLFMEPVRFERHTGVMSIEGTDIHTVRNQTEDWPGSVSNRLNLSVHGGTVTFRYGFGFFIWQRVN